MNERTAVWYFLKWPVRELFPAGFFLFPFLPCSEDSPYCFSSAGPAPYTHHQFSLSVQLYYVYRLLLFSRLVTESRDCGSSLTGQHLRSIGITRATSISGSSNSKLFLVIKYIMSKNFTNYYYKLSSGHKEDRYS